MAKNVTVIPATRNMHKGISTASKTKRKVAGYARVSTDSDEQFTSYEAQVDYYTNYIKSRPEWEFVGVYTDEGISALNTKKRDGFNRMVADALNGKIDLIVTKSVSRFARNTVDSLTTVRKLKDKGIEVYFEKENIWTMDSKGELLITIMSSLAQEESRSISENVTWGQRKRFADGKVSMPYKQFLGYRKGANGLPEIVPEEAEIVRRIYRMFINGKSPSYIARQLTSEGIPTPGKKKVWQSSTVESILANEKYKGDARLQKKFTTDYLTKKMKVNEGEVPQYYVENSHPAIIDPTEWEMVQGEILRRKNAPKRTSCNSPFSGKVICGDCGEWFGPKVWHSTDQYRRVIWQCNHKFKGEKKCTTPHLTEDALKEYSVIALSFLVENREALIEDGRIIKKTLSDHTEIDAEIRSVTEEIEIVARMIEKTIADNAITALNQDEYNKTYESLTERYEALKKRYTALTRQRDEKKFKADVLSGFLFELSELDLLDTEWSDSRFHAIVERITVHNDGRLVFTFCNGSEETVMM
ncbi:MAG: recombinase family protein [Clostridia bacterium]|nr:recombinase family protein [Clostridia bacterium]